MGRMTVRGDKGIESMRTLEKKREMRRREVGEVGMDKGKKM